MIAWYRGFRAARPACIPVSTRRCLSTSALESRLSEPVQSYVSTSRDPYFNLSIEHHFLQKSSPDSALLLLYVNRPSIIIGRNQNPWLEVNLALLNQSGERPETEPPGLGTVDLVRRRSGGGTVFHDEGNVNWTVICPSAKFTRDKHAEMVVRALRSCGVERARVNERHDIVLDQGQRAGQLDPEDTHVTPYAGALDTTPKPLKVSGSAYKLTRNRALHHGTCLLSSPNLNLILHFLHSPAKPYIKARGVESVNSPVGNILLSNEEFSSAVQKQFRHVYSPSQDTTSEEIGDELLKIDDVKRGYNELKSLEWTYLQTPQFTLSNALDDQARTGIELTVRHGVITEGAISGRDVPESPDNMLKSLHGRRLHEIDSLEVSLGSTLSTLKARDSAHLLEWLKRTLPVTSR